MGCETCVRDKAARGEMALKTVMRHEFVDYDAKVARRRRDGTKAERGEMRPQREEMQGATRHCGKGLLREYDPTVKL